MRYALKDKNLQKMMDDISRGEFSKRLDEGAKLNGITGVFEVRFNICGVYVEERQEYNPHGWNNFPAVKPPEGEFMRLEFDDGLLTGGRYDDKYLVWRDSHGVIFPDAFTVKRFRPWDD